MANVLNFPKVSKPIKDIDPYAIKPICLHCRAMMEYVADNRDGYLYECQNCKGDYQVIIAPIEYHGYWPDTAHD